MKMLGISRGTVSNRMTEFESTTPLCPDSQSAKGPNESSFSAATTQSGAGFEARMVLEKEKRFNTSRRDSLK
jgi:hypothetical protein